MLVSGGVEALGRKNQGADQEENNRLYTESLPRRQGQYPQEHVKRDERLDPPFRPVDGVPKGVNVLHERLGTCVAVDKTKQTELEPFFRASVPANLRVWSPVAG